MVTDGTGELMAALGPLMDPEKAGLLCVRLDREQRRILARLLTEPNQENWLAARNIPVARTSVLGGSMTLLQAVKLAEPAFVETELRVSRDRDGMKSTRRVTHHPGRDLIVMAVREACDGDSR